MDIDLTKVSGSYVYKGSIETWFDEEVALAYLLLNDVVCISEGKYIEEDWDGTTTILPDDGRKAPDFRHGDERCCGLSRLKTMSGL